MFELWLNLMESQFFCYSFHNRFYVTFLNAFYAVSNRFIRINDLTANFPIWSCLFGFKTKFVKNLKMFIINIEKQCQATASMVELRNSLIKRHKMRQGSRFKFSSSFRNKREMFRLLNSGTRSCITRIRRYIVKRQKFRTG